MAKRSDRVPNESLGKFTRMTPPQNDRSKKLGLI